MKGKKLISALLVVLMILSMLSGCDAESSEETSTPTDSVVTTEPTTAPTETETPTEEPTEAATEEPTEAPTEAETEVPTEVPTEEPTEAPTEPEFTVTAISKTMYVIQWANIRTGPGTTYDRITALDRGTAVYCIGVADNGWYKIKYNGGEAYIAGNLVSDTKPVDPPAETEPPATEPPTTEPPTTEPPATEHKHDYSSSVTAPTCTDKGYTTYTCSCGDSYKADETAATGHNMIETERLDSTCNYDGYYIMSCTECDYEENHKLDAHNYVEIDRYGNSCNGYKVFYQCTECEDIREKDVEGEGHDMVRADDYPPCGQCNFYDYVCTKCGRYEREHVDPIYPEHELDENNTCIHCGRTFIG